MSRHFTRANGDYITVGPGILTTDGGPTTVVLLWRATTLTAGTILDLITSIGYVVASFRSGSTGYEWVAYNGTASYQQVQAYTTATWRFDAWTKNTGSSVVRGHYANLGGSWTHTNYLAGTDSVDPVSVITFGDGDLLGHMNGDLAAAMVIERVLTDGEIETLQTGLAAWETVIGTTPAGLWAFNQVSIFDPVLDLTGGGGDQITISGTSIGTDPPGFSYLLGSPTDCTFAAAIPPVVGALAGVSSSTSAITAGLPALTAHLSIGANVPPPLMTGTAVVRGLTGTATAT